MPSQSSKILYQCFHPLKDVLQAVYGHEKQQNSKSTYYNGLIEQDPEGAHYDLEDT